MMLDCSNTSLPYVGHEEHASTYSRTERTSYWDAAARCIAQSCSQSHRLLQKTTTRLMTRFRTTGRIADRPRTARTPVTTPREDRHLRVLHMSNRFPTVKSSAAASLGHAISRRIVSRRFRRYDIRTYRPFRGMTLTLQHRRRRLAWARAVWQWQQRNWHRVLFSDKSRFQMNQVDGRVRVYRRQNERTARCCVQKVEPFGGDSVMMWGGICGDRKTELVVIEGNLTDDVLRPVVLPFLQQNPETRCFIKTTPLPMLLLLPGTS
ncbi:uncharacterized protein [Haliotis asinina]|uniref:uncharacterized protein n=1 Tax=Haliotis asinina TaxID=109174 RepID=UPI0035323F94